MEDVEDWQPESDKPCVADLAPFLVSIEDLQLNDGKMPPNTPKIPPSVYSPKGAAPEHLVEQPIISHVSKKRTLVALPRNRSELAHAIEETFNPKELAHPYKLGLKIKRSTPILPANSLPQNVAHFVVDQEVGKDSLVKAMTSPSDPLETFVWLYAPVEGEIVKDGRQVHQFQRDFTVQRNIRPDNFLTLYYPKSKGRRRKHSWQPLLINLICVEIVERQVTR